MRWLIVLAVAGCGRLDFDARLDARVGTDIGVDALGTGPFGMPMEIPMPNQSMTIDDPSETADGLELFVNVGSQVWASVRASTSDPWPLPTQLAGQPTIFSPHISADGLTLWCVNATPNLAYLTRATRTSPWGTLTLIPELATTSADDGPMVTGDGLTMVFDSTRGGATIRIYMASRASTADPWGVPAPLALPTSADVIRPHLSEDRLRLWLQSTNDIYMTERASVSDPWSALMPVAGLANPLVDGDPWLSLDEHRILISASRGTDAYSRIYEATR